MIVHGKHYIITVYFVNTHVAYSLAQTHYSSAVVSAVRNLKAINPDMHSSKYSVESLIT